MEELQQQEKTKGIGNKKAIWKKLFIATFIFLLIVMVGVTSLLGYMAIVLLGNYEIDESKLNMRQTSMIYDHKGQEVASFYLENRVYIPIDKIPAQLSEAFLAVEDRRFYQHSGLDYRAIARAIYKDILARQKVEGGSTITQQLAKNVFLTHEKNWMRKTEEVLIAIQLEKKYSKEQILEMYLNYIYFGHGAYGISAATEAYFDKPVQELRHEEMALLAALPKAPNHYSPFREENMERSEERRKLVLHLMQDYDVISEAELEIALHRPLEVKRKEALENPALLTYMDMVLDEAEEKYGISREEIMTGGYEIHTSLDVKAQETMYEAFQLENEVAQGLFPPAGPDQHVEGSMVIINNQTGGIVAVIGGRDYVRRGLNRATSDARQPGSTFKPIAAFAPALEAGWHPYDIIKDEQRDYAGYKPKNYDGRYRGNVTMLEALQQSYNAPAVWLLNEIGVGKGVQSANEFGFEHVNRELGIALGGVGASPIQMASAFGAFANQGIQMQTYLIENITSRNGEVLVQVERKNHQVVSPQTAWFMTRMLEKVVQDGTGKRAQLTHAVAGKTGTTQAPKGYNGVRDAWFVGYTPTYTAAVWMGFDQNSKTHVMETTGGNHPASLFRYVMEKVLEDQQPIFFTKPDGVEELGALKKPKPKKKEDGSKKKEQKKKKEREKEEKRSKREQEKERE